MKRPKRRAAPKRASRRRPQRQRFRQQRARRSPKRVRTPRRRNAAARSTEDQYARELALTVLADMRRTGAGLTAAARARRVDAAIVHRYVGSALRRRARGGYYAAAADRLPRTLSVLTARGSVWVTIRDSRTASLIAEYRNAIRVYRRTGDMSPLQPFQGRTFRAQGATYALVTDPETLGRLGHAGLLALESLYRAASEHSQ